MADDQNSWLRAAIREARTISQSESSSLHHSDAPISITEEFNPGRDPRLAEIVRIIRFSRKFILTYNAILLFILLAFAVVEWSGYIRRARNRRTAANRDQSGRVDVRSGASSSSSSTLEGTATPPDALKTGKAVNGEGERQPLIPKDHPAKQSGPLSRTIARTKAFLAYQPRPIPVINKVLPSNGQSLVILAFLGLNIFYLCFGLPFTIMTLFCFADRAGMLFAANLPILYLFAAKNQPITWLTGHSYESLNIFHRRLGEIVCALALVHFIGMIGVWYTLLVPFGFTFVRFMTSHVTLLGLGAFVCYELLYVTSLGTLRQRGYELFLFLHVFLQAGALVFLYLHHPHARLYVGIALAIFLVDRVVYRLNIKMTTTRVDLKVLDDKETVMLSGDWSVPESAGFLKRLLRRTVGQGWSPTDHVFLTVPAISHKHVVQAHPFTIASAAPNKPDGESSSHAWFNLLIRAQSGFSRDLVEYAHTHSTASVRLDGPYGSAHPFHLLQTSDLAIIVAGGSGIAVAFPLVWALLNQASHRDPESQRNGKPKKVCLLWVIRSRSNLSWLPKERLEELEQWGGEVHVPEPTEEVGRPDVQSIVRNWVDLNGKSPGDKTGVVCSGPDAMNRKVRNECSRMIGEGLKVGISVEKFGW
ncbi:ferric reductase transmembrane component [Saccharata proteae CBS 121410]|uniref:Ferric reductase transmembrane component n=1 Tax=Saccharata proteae CBS 121410 TaxID=1314787 RepID=A0A9P4LY20_9PEZI|nr:ferric reductase transmembrane component [Saccharata proteae CBS 121410]